MTNKTLEDKLNKLEKLVCLCCGHLPTTDGEPTEDLTNNQNVRIDPNTGIIYYWDGDSWEEISADSSTFGTTSLSPPVDAPVDDDPVVLMNLTTGILYYWNGISWLVGNDGGTDTNLANTDLTFTGNRLHEGAGYGLNIQNLLYAYLQIDHDTGRSIIGCYEEGGNGRYIRFESPANGAGTHIGNAQGEYYFDNVDESIPPTIGTIEPTHILAIRDTDGRIYRMSMVVNTNLATTDLIQTADRTYNAAGFNLDFQNCDLVQMISSGTGFIFGVVDTNNVSLQIADAQATLQWMDSGLNNRSALVADSTGLHLVNDNGIYDFVGGAIPVTLASGNKILVVNSTTKQIGVQDIPVSDVAYGVGWNGDTTIAPSKNAVYDQMELKADITALDNLKKDQIGITIDGGGSVITTGQKGMIRVPYSGTITGWTVLETTDTPVTGSITIDVWKDTYANYPPDVSDSIFTTKPSLSSDVKNQNLSPTFVGAGATITEGDIIAFNVEATPSNVKRVTVLLHITKS